MPTKTRRRWPWTVQSHCEAAYMFFLLWKKESRELSAGIYNLMKKMHSRRFLRMCCWTKWRRGYVRMSSESERYRPPTRLGTIPHILQIIECLCFPSSLVLAMPTKCSKRTLITQKRCTNEPTSHLIAGNCDGKIFWTDCWNYDIWRNLLWWLKSLSHNDIHSKMANQTRWEFNWTVS